MGVRDQIYSRQILAELKRNVGTALSNHVINADDPVGYQSRVEQVCFGAHNTRGIRIGTMAFCRNTNGTMNFDPIQAKVIATPTRARGTATRTSAV